MGPYDIKMALHVLSPARSLLVRCLARSLLLISIPIGGPAAAGTAVPDDFPRFTVPGCEQQMDSLRSLFWIHYQPAGPLIPLWDEWMPMSTLWPARGTNSASLEMRKRWAAALASRHMNEEGYIATQQHDGPAHAEGWPFPRWMEAGGIGWHFRGTGIQGYDGPPATTDGWKVTGGQGGGINEKGWVLDLTCYLTGIGFLAAAFWIFWRNRTPYPGLRGFN